MAQPPALHPDVKSFLAKAGSNAPPVAQVGDTQRILFALDATASREPTWDLAMHLHAELFRAAADSVPAMIAAGAVARANEQLPELKAFLLEADIVGIPSEEEAYVAEAPAYRRTNSAYIEIPGPYEEGLPAIYYIAGPDPEWPPEVQLQYVPGEADLLNTSVHEVWPGHFLHSLYSKRSDNRVGTVLRNGMLGEGWAHYAEELMQEAGLGDGRPLVRVGQILDALMRDVRFLSSIGLHVEGMSVETSRRMFAELAWLDPGNAEQQALRGTYDPGYFAYTLGKLIIVRMREDWTADRGGRAAWRAFHETLLSHGSAPLPALRKAVMGPEDPGTLL